MVPDTVCVVRIILNYSWQLARSLLSCQKMNCGFCFAAVKQPFGTNMGKFFRSADGKGHSPEVQNVFFAGMPGSWLSPLLFFGRGTTEYPGGRKDGQQ